MTALARIQLPDNAAPVQVVRKWCEKNKQKKAVAYRSFAGMLFIRTLDSWEEGKNPVEDAAGNIWRVFNPGGKRGVPGENK